MPRAAKPRWFPPRSCWRYREGGRSHYAPRSIGPADEAGAWRWAASLSGEGRPAAGAVASISVADLRNLYLQHLEGRVGRGEYAPGTYALARIKTRFFRDLPGIAGLPIDRVDARHAELLRAATLARGRSSDYASILLEAVSAMLNWATRPKAGRVPERLLPSNPWAGVEMPRVRKPKAYVEPARLRKFLRLARGLTRKDPAVFAPDNLDALLLVRLARLTGARPGELCGLLWADVDLDAGVAVLPSNRHKTGRHTRADRHIFLEARAIRLLRLLPRRADGYVFGRTRSGPWQTQDLDQRFARWNRRLAGHGLGRIIPYDLRHTYCTDALGGGTSYADVSKLVGNSPATLARYYDHPVLARLAGVAAEIAERRRRPTGPPPSKPGAAGGQ